MSARADHAWRAGDLAVCVAADGPWFHLENGKVVAYPGPAPEQMLRVASVFGPMLFKGCFGEARTDGLSFDEFPDFIYPCPLFRRVKPDAEAGFDGTVVFAIKRDRVGEVA